MSPESSWQKSYQSKVNLAEFNFTNLAEFNLITLSVCQVNPEKPMNVEKQDIDICHLKVHDKNITIQDKSCVYVILRFSFARIVLSFPTMLPMFTIICTRDKCVKQFDTGPYEFSFYYKSPWVHVNLEQQMNVEK